MNVSVPVRRDGENKYWSLGLVRITGSMPAERLLPHGISLEHDIVCITTDGDSVLV